MSQRANLFLIAAANAPMLEQRLQEMLEQKPLADRDTLMRFANSVRATARVAMNMRLTELSSFLALGAYQNIYEWAGARARLSGRPVQEILQGRLGVHYPARTAFDAHFEEGETFRYGALNLGGAGATYFGQFCVVLADLPSLGARAAYLPADSLKVYMGPGPAVDETAIARDAAPHSHRGHLAALTYQTDICRTADEGWPAIVCSDATYIEVIFSEETRPENVECVRVEDAHYRELADLAFDDFRRQLPDGDRAIVGHFFMVLQRLEQVHIRLERV